MKKRQRRLSGFLLACMMVCLPVSQAMAARSVDVSEGAGGQVLFPGDILNNAALPIMKDGAAVGTDTPGSWTNTEEGTVYTASTSEDGSAIILSAAGSVLVVENGTASKNDGSDDSKNHYTFPADEVPSVPQDIAYYQAGETVKIRAAQPQEGMTFAGWTTSSSEVSFGDAASSETTITMPGSRTTVTATYQEVQPDTPAPDPNVSNDPAADPNAGNDPAVDPNVGNDPVADPNAGNDPAADPNAGDNTITIDPIATTYTVTVQDGTGEGAYAPGDWVTITAKDYEGKAFNGWYVDNMNATLENAEAQETGFVMPEANVKVSAQYTDVQPVLYGVTINNGIISDETGAVSFAEGATVSVTANDRTQEGLTFAGWFVESRNTEPQDILAMTTSFVMPKGDVVISATYTEAEPPQTDAPQTDAPQTDAPQTDAPQTDALQTDAPQTDAPQTDAPQTDAPQTDAPQTDAPQTDTPQTDAPQTDTPQTDAHTYEVVVENGAGSGTYEAGSTVTVEARSEEDKVFQSWETSSSGVQMADPTQEITTFTMPEEGVVVTAEYAVAAYNVTVENGILNEEAGNQTGRYSLNQENVKIKANAPADGMIFKNWSVKINGAEVEAATVLGNAAAEETVLNKVTGETVITANYEAAPDPVYIVTVANGTLSSAEAAQDALDSSKWIVKGNRQVVITANPNPAGQAFTGWKITDEQGTELNPADLGIVDAASSSLALAAVGRNLNFQAQYEGIQYKVTVNDGIGNYTTAVSGTVVTITADEAPAGMEFDYWKVETGNASLADSLSETTSFTMPMADVAVSAFYKLKEYKLTVENGTASQEYFHMGDAATVSSNYPASGKEFNEWVAASGNVAFADPSRWKTSFAMPASDVAVKATYKDGPSPNDNRILDIVPGGEYYTGTTIKFTASGAGMGNSNPNPGDYRYRPTGYQIGKVTGSWNSSPYTVSMAIKAAGEYTLKVTYSKDVYDGSTWVADGTTDTKSVTFRVIAKAAGVATGDDTPIAVVIAAAVVSCILFIILLVVVIRRRRNR